MPINKVQYGNRTLIDLSNSTLQSSDELVSGVTAYDRSGTKLTGTANYMPLIDNPQSNMVVISNADGEVEESPIIITDVATISGDIRPLQSAINNKQDTLDSGTNIKTINGNSVLGSGDLTINKNSIGLGNVDNTSDLNKPISTATQNALNLKQGILTAGDYIDITNNVISGDNQFYGTTFNGDIDTLTTAGMYYCYQATNLPEGVAGMLLVFSNTQNRSKQIFIRTGTKNSNEQFMYQRSYQNGWGEWYKYAPHFQYANSNANVSCPNSTWTEVVSRSLTAGTYLCFFGGTWAINATGIRAYGLYDSVPSGNSFNRENSINQPAIATYYTAMGRTCLLRPTSTTTYSLYALQTSGGSLSAYGSMVIQRIA